MQPPQKTRFGASTLLLHKFRQQYPLSHRIHGGPLTLIVRQAAWYWACTDPRPRRWFQPPPGWLGPVERPQNWTRRLSCCWAVPLDVDGVKQKAIDNWYKWKYTGDITLRGTYIYINICIIIIIIVRFIYIYIYIILYLWSIVNGDSQWMLMRLIKVIKL